MSILPYSEYPSIFKLYKAYLKLSTAKDKEDNCELMTMFSNEADQNANLQDLCYLKYRLFALKTLKSLGIEIL